MPGVVTCVCTCLASGCATASLTSLPTALMNQAQHNTCIRGSGSPLCRRCHRPVCGSCSWRGPLRKWLPAHRWAVVGAPTTRDATQTRPACSPAILLQLRYARLIADSQHHGHPTQKPHHSNIVEHEEQHAQLPRAEGRLLLLWVCSLPARRRCGHGSQARWAQGAARSGVMHAELACRSLSDQPQCTEKLTS